MAPPYTYPVAGALFFLRHPSQLWLKTLCPLLLTLGFGLVSIVLAFLYLLPLQRDALIDAHWPTWIAWVASVIFVLLESAVANMILFAVLVPFFQDAVFDATLKARGLQRMFDGRVEVPGLVACWRNMGSSLTLAFIQVLLFIITTPLHLIPVVGTALACCINGWPKCWSHFIHYDVDFRGMTAKESLRFAWNHRKSYCLFGTVAVALELVPVANLIFVWTNIVGAALWAGDNFEKAEQLPRGIGASGNTSVASIYPSVKSLNSHVPSMDSEHSRLLQTANAAEGYGSAAV
ncbi:uncharacterized protein BYT42DRAFT_648511 [Radiomyces spectabilis]|uniref:uncharacterized protein n=1 Tax=Radiomyces spectabilis TaxID=64574 RepID=UPI00221FAA4F|nr:uncharacterized protein BYT42DRAFT_648511 [Radiomyces spectabilis]KAI8367475.1 hypothetical protein BYT42DRAFT_648511 [Radiomyces spectabilis]